MKKLFQNDVFIGPALALVAFGVYLNTLASSVQHEDCGEIATSLYTLGILHPTGYPLFTLLGWVFSHLPIGGRVVWKLNLMVAVLCSASLYFFYQTFVLLLSEKSRFLFGKKKIDAKAKIDAEAKAVPISTRLVAAITALILAFSRTFWSEAVSVEVYSLHLLFLSMVTLFFLRSLMEEAQQPGLKKNLWWPAFAFTLGLSFTNHMMTVLLAPAFLYLFFTAQGFGRAAWIKIARAVPLFALGLTPYFYIIIRASQHPLMNWGDPSTLERFGWHLSAQQYRYKMFSSASVAVGKLQQFFIAFPAEFGYAPLLLAVVGVWALFRNNLRLGVFSLLLFVGCVFYAVNYDFEDPNFYLNAYFAAAIWMLFGVGWLVNRSGPARWVGLALGIACVLFPLALNYSAEDKSRDFAVEDYARNMLNSVEPGGILLLGDDKLLITPAMYLQIVEGVRPDVVILSVSLMMYGWHLEQLQRLHPGILEKVRPELDAYLDQNSAYEAHYYGSGNAAAFDTSFYKASFQHFLERVMWSGYPERAVHVQQGIRSNESIQRIPVGLTFRLFLDSLPPLSPFKEFDIRPLVGNNPVVQIVRTEYARAYTNQAIYRAVVAGDTARGIQFLREALLMKPDYPAALQWLNRLAGRS